VISSIILCFLSHFVRRRGGRGSGAGGRGVGHRRMRPSLTGRRGAEEAGALTGGGVARGVAGSDARRRGRRGAEEVGARYRAV
jgi:hypothetical protein